MSLHRLVPVRHGLDPANWMAVAPSPGTVAVVYHDTDGDGMPDAWEDDYELDRHDPADAALDADKDGMTNLAEYQSGTSPRDPSSRLELAAARNPDGTILLRFIARAKRSYSVEFRGTAGEGTWQRVQNVEEQAYDVEVEIEDSSSDGFEARFYRVVTPALP